MRRNRRILSVLTVFTAALLLTASLSLSAFADLSSEAGGKTILSLDFTDSAITTNSAAVKGMQLGGNIKYGGLTTGSTADGNEYYKFFVDDTNVGTTATDPFGGFYFSSRNSSKTDGAFKDYSYFTVDFDLTTENSFVHNMSFFLCSRNESGSLKNASSCLFRTTKGGDGQWYFANSNGKKTVSAGAPNTWHHFTFIVRVDHSNGTNYSKTSVLVYIDGNYFETYTNVLNDGAYYYDTVRYGIPNTLVNNISVCFDNVLIRGYELNYQGPIASVVSNTPATLQGNSDTVYYTDYQVPILPVVSLNGKNYSSFDEAYENAKVLDTLKLYEAIEEEKTIDRELLIDCNGLDFAYSTTLTVTKFGEDESLLLFTDGSPTMTVTFRLLSDEYTEELTWGDPIALPDEFSTVFAKDGFRYDFIDFTGSDEQQYGTDIGSVTLERLHTDLILTANYNTAKILFESIRGEVSEYFTDFSDFAPLLMNADQALSVRLHSDYFAECGIYLPTEADLTINLNGYSLSSAGRVPLFILSQGSALNVTNDSVKKSKLTSDSTVFYLYGDASVNVCSSVITVVSPTIADGVRSDSAVTFSDCTLASSGAEIDSIRLDGGKLKMQNVTVIGDAEIHLNGSQSSAEVTDCIAVSGISKEALFVLTGGATATVTSSAVCGKFAAEDQSGISVASDCRMTAYYKEGYFEDGAGLSADVKEMYLLSFYAHVRAEIPENEKLNGKKRNDDLPDLDITN